MRFSVLIILMTIISCPKKASASQDTLKAWDVVINEVMADPDPPAGKLTYPEYIELYNKKSRPVSLKNWRFCVGATCKTLPDISIPADSFLVLTSATSLKFFSPGINALGITGFPALINTGQMVQLVNDAGNIVHVISYTDEWYRDAIKKEGGYSLEQLDGFNPCGGEENWKACVHPDGGTPGRRNSVAVINKDTEAPEILRVNVLSSDLIEVIFSEPLDSASLKDIAVYHIEGMEHPKIISLIKPYYRNIVLQLSDSLKTAVTYTLTVERTIKDCTGNALKQSNPVHFAIPSTISPKDVVINEILFNPPEGGVDFIEIYNCSAKVVDLKTLFLCHFDTMTQTVSDVKRITSASYLFFPGEYLVLTENAEIVKSQYKTENPQAFLNVEVLPSMNTNSGNIALKSMNELIDQLTYREQMHFALLKETRGISLERVYFGRSTNDVTNWHSASSSVDFATPGYKNSQYVDELLTDDAVSVYPEIFSPDEDGVDDLVTLQYRLEEPVHTITILIYDEQGRLVRTLVNNRFIGTEGSYSWDGINDQHEKERKGMYILFTRITNDSGKIKVYKKVCVLSGKD